MRLPTKSVLLTGLTYIAVLLFHIPDAIFRHGFDKNGAAQFLSVAFAAAIFSIYIAFNAARFQYTKILKRITLGLVAALLTSAVMSGNIIGSIIGDTGRFVGVISALSLLIIAIYHARFNWMQFRDLLSIYFLGVEVVVVLGLLQHFNLIELPGDSGMSSTLGNVDLYAAFVATSLPLFIYRLIGATRRTQLILALAAAVNIYALKLAGPKQAWVDIALTALAWALYFIARKLPRREVSLNKRTYLGTFAVVIWAEIIFLIPFLGEKVPVIGSDIQVKIRTNFWIDGIRQFLSHPLLGVGPDQYGNYYEKFRTIDDVKMWPNILSNDAHSAAVQTLATLGAVGTLLYLALIATVIRSLLILWDKRTIDRKAVFALGLYIFIYLTNSFISPITPSHKYLFWAVCGFIVGRVYLVESDKASVNQKIFWAVPAITLLAVGALFAAAQATYLQAMEKYAANNSAKIEYSYNPLLPCFMYGDAQMLVASNFGKEVALDRARELLRTNPRCARALTVLSQDAADRDDIKALGPLLNDLEDVAPWRSSTMSVEMFYANRTRDAQLAERIQKRMNTLGLVYVPGKLG